MSAFSVAINYDTAIASALSASFGGFSFASDNPSINLTVPGKIYLSNAAMVNRDLSGEGNGFVIATIIVHGANAGTSALTIDPASSIAGDGGVILPYAAQNGSLTVNGGGGLPNGGGAEDVPLPPWAIALMGAGILLLGMKFIGSAQGAKVSE